MYHQHIVDRMEKKDLDSFSATLIKYLTLKQKMGLISSNRNILTSSALENLSLVFPSVM